MIQRPARWREQPRATSRRALQTMLPHGQLPCPGTLRRLWPVQVHFADLLSAGAPNKLCRSSRCLLHTCSHIGQSLRSRWAMQHAGQHQGGDGGTQ